MPLGHLLGHRLGHPLGHRIGERNEESVGGWPVKLLGHGSIFTSSAATSASLGKGAMGLKVGDLQVIIQLATSAPTTPTGYTLLASVPGNGFVLSLYVYGKTVATSGEASTSVGIAQASSGILQGVIVGLRGAKATPVLDVSATASLAGDTNNPQPFVGATALNKGLALAIGGVGGVSGTPTYTYSSGWTDAIGSAFNSRMSAAWRNCNASQVLSGTVQSSSFSQGTSENWDKATLTFK